MPKRPTGVGSVLGDTWDYGNYDQDCNLWLCGLMADEKHDTGNLCAVCDDASAAHPIV